MLRRTRKLPLLCVAIVAATAATAACSSNVSGSGGSSQANAGSTQGAVSAPAASAKGTPLKIAVVDALSGGQVPSSVMWRAGIALAVKQINAAGGILGHPVKTTVYDTASSPAQSVAAMKKALQDKPYVVLGTILSSETLANMGEVAAAGVPQIVGSASPDIAAKNPTNLFYTEPNSNLEAEMFSNYLTKQAHVKRVDMIYSSDAFGVSGNQSFVTILKKAGVDVVDQLKTNVGQTDFSGDVARIQKDKPDTVFMYMHETETGRFLQQAQNAGLQGKIRFTGASSALSASTVKLAGSAANGVEGFDPYNGAAPSMAAIAKDYVDSHNGAEPDHNYFKGYVAMWMVAYATQDVGKIDQKALIDDLHSKTFCVSKYPNLLESTHWDASGNIDRSTFIVKVNGSNESLVSTIPPLQPDNFTQCGS